MFFHQLDKQIGQYLKYFLSSNNKQLLMGKVRMMVRLAKEEAYTVQSTLLSLDK